MHQLIRHLQQHHVQVYTPTLMYEELRQSTNVQELSSVYLPVLVRVASPQLHAIILLTVVQGRMAGQAATSLTMFQSRRRIRQS